MLDAGGDTEAQARLVAARALEAEVTYLGEHHDNPAHHLRQRQVVAALLGAGARPALAFEMLEQGQQAAVGPALAESRTADDLGRRLRWRERGWPDFAMYWPLFDLAGRAGLSVVAADLDPTVARRIARDGLGAVGVEGARLASRLPPDARREAAIADTIREAHCRLLPEGRLPSMVAAWHARNVAMARRLVEALERSPRVVVIAGRGHQEPGGLPDQLAVVRPRTRQLIVDLAEVPASRRPDEVAAGSRADVVWLTHAVERPDPCAPLRRSGGGAPRSRASQPEWEVSLSMLVMRR